jgi:hypothetical protein
MLSTERKTPHIENSVDVVRHLAATLPEGGYQLMGGVVTKALSSLNILISPQDRTVLVRDEMYLPTWRMRDTEQPDGVITSEAVSRRDADYLLLTTDSATIHAQKQETKAAAGKRIDVSVFGLHPYEQLEQQMADPFGSLATVWVSDRYVTNTGLAGEPTEASEVHKGLFPFAAEVDPELCKTWTLRLEGNKGLELPMPHPAAMILNYLTRSLSGLRPKDLDKINVAAANIFNLYPDALQILRDGKGKKQVDLAGALYTLRGGKRTTLIVGNQETHNTLMIRGADSVQQLRGRSEFGLHDAPSATQAAVLRISALKSRVLHRAEGSNLVNWWQAAGMEQVVEAIITNKR